MTYALRKLIAFVFLGGLFWFIYQDLDNLGEDWFMHALGLITVVFALFWLFIPMVVVWTRRRRRVRRNRERYEKWLSEGGAGSVRARRADGAMSIWCATPGLSTPSGWSEESMREIIGIKLGLDREKRQFRAAGTDGREGYEPHSYVYIPRGWTESPRVFVDDDAAKVWAKWKDDGRAAFAAKRLADGTDSVFLGMPYNRAAQWAELLASAGCHAFAEPGFMVRRNSRRLMVFSARGGNTSYEISVLTNQMSQAAQVEVKLERPYAVVRDSMTGETVAENAKSFTLRSDVTRLWMLETIDRGPMDFTQTRRKETR